MSVDFPEPDGPMDAVLLRDHRRSDFESMWELDQACFPRGIAYSRSELRAFLSRKKAETIVAERERRIVAFVLGSRRGPTDGHVITLDVAASARRQGLGRQLLAEIERRFRAAGVRRVQLETAVTNAAAIAFYERLGYRKVAHLARYYGPGLHAWKMEKALDGTPAAAQPPPSHRPARCRAPPPLSRPPVACARDVVDEPRTPTAALRRGWAHPLWHSQCRR